jgi:hypothetical protein
MSRFGLVPALLLAILLSLPASAQNQDYCQTDENSPECYCLAKEHRDKLKCLRFFGSNPGFTSKGVGTSATFNAPTQAQPPAQGPPPPPTQTPTQNPPIDRSLYTLFIHYGAPDDMTGLPNISSLVQALREQGWVVRGADNQKDASGSGIDYFRPQDKAAAEAIATSVNKWLGDSSKPGLSTVKPRLQSTRNPPGYIGVWIFGRAP